ncbi:MAG: hypothetical protein RMY34_06615 [Aulosira sp. DedQUE10]|nr:hypothetical protein [Aulosira sp. DedQUE10]
MRSSSRPELKFRANSQSPLKWTEIDSLVYFSRLELLALEFIPRRDGNEAGAFCVYTVADALGSHCVAEVTRVVASGVRVGEGWFCISSEWERLYYWGEH